MDRAEQELRRRKARDRSLALLVLGLAMSLPPLAGLFQLDAKLAGLPAALVYLFVLWACLIAGAAMLSRSLGAGDGP